jgi:hypothetical protein
MRTVEAERREERGQRREEKRKELKEGAKTQDTH